MAYTIPTIADFKARFVRDFPYGVRSDQVNNADIQTALDDTEAYLNESLFDSQAAWDVNFLLLAAHNMVMNMRAARANLGLSGQFGWLQSSKGVGSVSESFAIPDRILANPELAMLTKTYYGAKFLFNILPSLSGNIYTVQGETQP